MDLHVINRNLGVGHIRINGVTTSSLVIIGDADAIQLSSTFDTPPESLIIGQFVPLDQE